ncbi:MAG: hypothetical protein CME71_06330 [Halobacteriovorax sp.]|nr:hypothetical protein [Halobacteriovorax sp.]|tara:strand:- start:551 stop:1237 length:687 start_codon:yes stop_codon:yes gene_type:complete
MNKLFCLLIFISAPVWASVEYISGEAKSRTGELKYKEQHTMTFDGQDLKRVETKYFNTQGEEFASLLSIFESSSLLPTSVFSDKRTGKIEKTEVVGDKYKVTTIDAKGQAKSDELKIDSNMLCGQGYHNYIRANLNSFKEKEIREIKFIIPSRRDYFSFDLSLLKQDKETKTFKLAITNWLLKMFADSIEVDYDHKGNLLAYRGLSNIQDSEGNNMDVVITLNKVEGF